ncbi:hypothetical protein [Emticicia sp. TH156]|uniref:hypothetical protein n=1 Tax=Emticicia sp. TH156 TaxID=2067454 RepID=UPI000C77AF9D|nr:hypothetical protein [Emticicia sp. TH156]PLK44670.1 hypothetical protein C0V77_09400 [Emticicia sp. TH156]
MKSTKNLFIILLICLGIGAIGGRGVLKISPDGSLMGMPVSKIANSPFKNFLIPGIILVTVLQIVPCLLAIALYIKTALPIAERLNFFSDVHWACSFSIYTAFALISWLQVQMAIF